MTKIDTPHGPKNLETILSKAALCDEITDFLGGLEGFLLANAESDDEECEFNITAHQCDRLIAKARKLER
jgi:hypothetical protein